MKRSVLSFSARLIALGSAAIGVLGTVSIAAAQTLPEPTATPVIAAVPASANWSLFLLGGLLALAIGWGVWKMRLSTRSR